MSKAACFPLSQLRTSTSAGRVWFRSGVRPLPDSTLTPSLVSDLSSLVQAMRAMRVVVAAGSGAPAASAGSSGGSATTAASAAAGGGSSSAAAAGDGGSSAAAAAASATMGAALLLLLAVGAALLLLLTMGVALLLLLLLLAADPEKKKASVRDSYNADIESKQSAKRQRYQEDLEENRAANRQRYQEDLEENRAAKRQKYEDNSAAIKASERNRYWNDPAVRLAKRAAERKRSRWAGNAELSVDPLASISSRACKGHDGYESVGVAVAGFRSRAYAGYYTIEMAARKVYVVGVGMTKFEKPGSKEDFDYPDMAKEAATKALKDAGIPYSSVEQAVVGYVYGDSTCGQRAVYELGLTGIPVFNVNNNCSTGSTALLLAKQMVEGGTAHCVLALGFEKMAKGSLKASYSDRANPVEKHVTVMAEKYGIAASPITPQMFASAGKEHMEKYGTRPEHFAKIAWKNHHHSVNNPYSQFRDEYSLEQIMQSRMIHEPMTMLQCCPTSDGSGAAIVCSEEFVKRHGLEGQAVEIVAMEMATDLPSTFNDKSCMKMVGYDVSKAAADKVFKKSGYKPQDVQVVELHDCFSANELITYEALGLCPPGKAGEMIDRGDNTYGGKYVVNPSGGLISKGHPLGATGLAQCAELCWQLRGLAEKRQVPGVKLALQHNLGLGGAAVVALYRLGFPERARRNSNGVGLSMAATAGGAKLKSDAILSLIEERVKKEGSELVKKVKASFLLKITGSDGVVNEYLVDLKEGNGSFAKGTGKGDVTITMSDDDFFDLATGKLNAQKAFFAGKLKLAGNTAAAMKLQAIMPSPVKAKFQQIFECVVDVNLTKENRHKLIPKAKILDDLKNRAAVSDFSPVKQKISDYPGEEVLLVYDYDFMYGENFYVCVTEEAKALVLNPPVKAEESSQEKKEEEGRRHSSKYQQLLCPRSGSLMAQRQR
ncbi:hypothetical protein EMCRGX_G019043 [Ephydatia muelleri]